eukprot:972114-Pleurochrysis_carterae.AAC.2
MLSAKQTTPACIGIVMPSSFVDPWDQVSPLCFVLPAPRLSDGALTRLTRTQTCRRTCYGLLQRRCARLQAPLRVARCSAPPARRPCLHLP